MISNTPPSHGEQVQRQRKETIRRDTATAASKPSSEITTSPRPPVTLPRRYVDQHPLALTSSALEQTERWWKPHVTGLIENRSGITYTENVDVITTCMNEIDQVIYTGRTRIDPMPPRGRQPFRFPITLKAPRQPKRLTCKSQLRWDNIEPTLASEERPLEGSADNGHPPDMSAAIARVTTLGQALFLKDTLASKATDVLFDAKILPADRRVRGWLTLPRQSKWVVRFVGESGEGYAALYDVHFPSPQALSPVLKKLSPPQPLGAEAASMFRARQTALATPFRMCSKGYNTVVLPGELMDEPGWLVYLLASSDRAGEIFVGGHHRHHISADGIRLLESLPLSKSCLQLSPSPPEAQDDFSYVTHLLSDWPIETHVFVSLLHQKALYVATAQGLWEVKKGDIHFVRE